MKYLEDAIQIEYVARARQLFPWVGDLLYHVPNGGRRDIKAAVRFKRLGVVPGIPDINIDIPCAHYHGMRLECKRDEKQKPTEHQRAIHDQLRANGYYVVVCWTVLDALKDTANYFFHHHDPDVRDEALRVFQSLMKA